MKITYFIRDNNNNYSELCNIASIELTKNKKTYYLGCQWGENNPTDAIECIITEPEILESTQWLNSLGYEIVQQQIQ